QLVKWCSSLTRDAAARSASRRHAARLSVRLRHRRAWPSQRRSPGTERSEIDTQWRLAAGMREIACNASFARNGETRRAALFTKPYIDLFAIRLKYCEPTSDGLLTGDASCPAKTNSPSDYLANAGMTSFASRSCCSSHRLRGTPTGMLMLTRSRPGYFFSITFSFSMM